jgi:hypothetical protein
MPYIEVGAVTTDTRDLFPSKAAIKRAWAADPASVTFISVATVVAPSRGQAFNGPVTCPADLPAGTKLTVVGPDPERKRNYYGTVEVAKGAVKIS